MEKKLERDGGVRKLTILTQNVDGLHKAAGSRNVVEIHGSLFKTRCTVCADVQDNWDSPICEALRGRGYVECLFSYSFINEKQPIFTNKNNNVKIMRVTIKVTL